MKVLDLSQGIELELPKYAFDLFVYIRRINKHSNLFSNFMTKHSSKTKQYHKMGLYKNTIPTYTISLFKNKNTIHFIIGLYKLDTSKFPPYFEIL
jgi:hypothetical protein